MTEKVARKNAKAVTKTGKAAGKSTAKGLNAAKANTNKGTKNASEPGADTKKAIVLALLRREKGATTADIAKATNWQNHSIRGFISGNVTKKMGLAVESFKSEAGERTYRIQQ